MSEKTLIRGKVLDTIGGVFGEKFKKIIKTGKNGNGAFKGVERGEKFKVPEGGRKKVPIIPTTRNYRIETRGGKQTQRNFIQRGG